MFFLKPIKIQFPNKHWRSLYLLYDETYVFIWTYFYFKIIKMYSIIRVHKTILLRYTHSLQYYMYNLNMYLSEHCHDIQLEHQLNFFCVFVYFLFIIWCYLNKSCLHDCQNFDLWILHCSTRRHFIHCLTERLIFCNFAWLPIIYSLN